MPDNPLRTSRLIPRARIVWSAHRVSEQPSYPFGATQTRSLLFPMQRRDFLKGAVVASVGVVGLGCSAIRQTTSGLAAEGLITPFDLRCESLDDPLGIDSVRPRLSWKLKAIAEARNQTQSAYRISVASSEAGLATGVADLWDSGWVVSPQQLHIEYAGRALASGERAFWRVQVRDGDGLESLPSAGYWWEMGLPRPEDWQGQWISDGKALPATDQAHFQDDPAPLFRRPFRIDKPVRRARLYAAGLGYYECRLNGQKVSDHALDPAWTSFESRVFYTTHDVTASLREGENVLGALVGNGWYNPLPLRMWGRINLREHLPVGRPTLMAQLVVEFEDGTTIRIATDPAWRVSEGPIVRNSVFLGEEYDARLEQSGWDEPGFDDSDWRAASPAKATDHTPGALCAMPIPPIRVTATLHPVSLVEVSPGVYIFDLGQNFAGWVRLRVQGPRGTKVIMRTGELLYPDGTLNPMTAVAGQIKGLNTDGTPRGGPGSPEIAWQSDSYVLRGGGPEEYTPRFTFHGFRYVEVTGFPGVPTLDSIEGLRLNTDVPSNGSFSCSNERFNQIQRMVEWTFLSNLFSVQSDCPAREKFQYGGDIVASSEMALLNFDMATFYAKTVSDHADAVRGDGWFTETAPYVGISAENYVKDAGPIGWGLAHPVLVAQLYQYYGDRRIVQEHFEAARTWVDLLEQYSDGYIIDRCIGDHESLDPKPIELIATAQFHLAASLVAGFADTLQRPEDAAHYRQLAAQIKTAFVEHFLEPGTGRFGIGTQAAQSAALYLGLTPNGEFDRAVKHMVDEVLVTHGGHIATGIFGTKYLLNALTDTGHSEVAYRMVDQPDYPGWGHMLEQGATTLWETWAQSDNVYSQNHPMFSAVSEWFFKGLGGIKPVDSAAGFDRFLIEPSTVSALDWVGVSYESVRGTIGSRWRREDDVLYFDLEIPVNTTAVVRLPARDVALVQESGRAVSEVPFMRPVMAPDGQALRLELGSGRYAFVVRSS
ncbi:MAG: alpha-L-rhamnosidase [Rhodothermales bacterium]